VKQQNRLNGRVRALARKALPRRVKELLAPYWESVLGGRHKGCAVRAERSRLDVGRFDGFEVVYRKGTTDEEILLGQSFSADPFFSAISAYTPGAEDVIVDVGAHIGSFSLLAARRVPKGVVHAVEPCRDSYNLLRVNVILNESTNVVTHRLALGDRNGTVALYHSEEPWGHTIVSDSERAESSASKELVECLSLETFFERNKIERCNLLRLNCEGAEFPILMNANSDTLRRCEHLLVLYHGDLWKAHTESDLLRHLRSCGFTCEVKNRFENRGWIIAHSPAPAFASETPA